VAEGEKQARGQPADARLQEGAIEELFDRHRDGDDNEFSPQRQFRQPQQQFRNFDRRAVAAGLPADGGQ